MSEWVSESAIPIFWESSSFLTLQEKERRDTGLLSTHRSNFGCGFENNRHLFEKNRAKNNSSFSWRQSVMYYLYQILSLKFYLMYYLGLRRTTWRPLDAGSTFWIQSVGGKFALSRMYVTFVRAMKKLFWRGIAIEVHARARFSWLATGYLHRYVQVAWIG